MNSTNSPIDDLLLDIQSAEGEDFVAYELDIKQVIEANSVIFSNLTLKVLAVFGGFFAAMAFTGFLFALGIYDSEVGLTVIGSIFIVASIFVSQLSKSVLLDTFRVAFYMIGCGMLTLGLSQIIKDASTLKVCLMLVALATIYLSDSYMLIVLATMLFCGSLTTMFIEGIFRNVSDVFILLGLTTMTFLEARFVTSGHKANILFRPVQMGLFMSFVSVVLFSPSFGRYLSSFNQFGHIVFSAVLVVGILFLVYKIAHKFGVEQMQHLALFVGLGLLILTPIFFTHILLSGIFLMLLSFYFGYQVQFAISLMLFVYGVSRYYFYMDQTLLVKSGILCATGFLFLVAGYFFIKQLKRHENN